MKSCARSTSGSGQGLGNMLLKEADDWIRELGYREVVVDSRTVATGFYEKNGFRTDSGEVIKSWNFDCIRMRKSLGTVS